MRISTSQIFDSGIRRMQQASSAVLRTQNQIAADRRMLTPSDDPVASAQVLVVSQSASVNVQHQTNQSNAMSQLRLVDSSLTSALEVLQNVRTSLIQGGSTASMTKTDRESIATQLESDLSELLGIANTDNGVGEYLFSGYQGGTKPFAIGSKTAIAPATTSPVEYFGDDGDRLLQVSASRQMAVTVSGSDVFMEGVTGNGTFVTTAGSVGVSIGVKDPTSTLMADAGAILDRGKWAAAVSNASVGQPLEVRFTDATHYGIYDPISKVTTGPLVIPSNGVIPLVANGGVDFGAQVVVSGTPVAGDSLVIQPHINQGSGVIDGGSVTDFQKWQNAVNGSTAGLPLEIRFSINAVTSKTEYRIYDPISNTETAAQSFTPGQTIPLKTSANVDFGAQVTIKGTPQPGDAFAIAPSTQQSVFQTLQNMIGILRSPVGSAAYSSTQFSNDFAGQMATLDQAMAQVSEVQSQVGANLKELDSLVSTSSDLGIQYAATIADLDGLDYYEAYSTYTKQQMTLEAAQKSFNAISGLSLFKYI